MTQTAQRFDRHPADEVEKNPAGGARQPEAGFTAAQIQTAQYIADMVLELRNMAKGAAIYAAMVPLEYAYYEAFAIANRVNVPSDKIEHLNSLGEDVRRAEASAER